MRQLNRADARVIIDDLRLGKMRFEMLPGSIRPVAEQKEAG